MDGTGTKPSLKELVLGGLVGQVREEDDLH